jgi:DNA (cytosine-5)-methyltransferase 1
MLTPQFLLDIHRELVVDLFAGGGGASTGIEQAIGRSVDIAINHDPEAVSLHEANHPQTRHYTSDVFEVDPLTVTEGRPVGLLWASPDCKHFSKAKGGKPVSKKIRSLAWVVIKWASAVRPRVICLENVEEFQTWGPLGADNRPCPQRKGRTFKRWVSSLQQLGYTVEWRELRACDFGAPTIRKRLFLVARCDAAPIAWPQPTHGAPDSLPVRQKKLKPWPTAAECIDWSIPAPSIFTRERPLAEATMRRIAKGVMRYVVNAADPFIVENHEFATTWSRAARRNGNADWTKTGTGDLALSAPPGPAAQAASTGLAGSNPAVVAPLITKYHGESAGSGGADPFPTVTANSFHKRPGGNPPMALVSAFLAKHYGGVVGSDVREAIGTVTSVDHHSVVGANLVHLGHGEGADGTRRFSHGVRDLQQPLNTITASGATAGLVTSNMIKLRGDNVGSAAAEPLHTISAQGLHHGEVRAFLIKYYGTDQDPRLAEPMHTIPTKDRFGLVMVHGEPYAIVDIGLRMLAPRELYRAQGFPETYIIDRGADGRALTKTAQVRMCGNSVCPPLARAIVTANYRELVQLEQAA